MWHLHGQYAQIEPTCDPFSLVCWGYFSSSLGPSQPIFSHARMCLLGLNKHYTDDKCLAQENNTVPQVRLKPATPQSLVKHSTTKQLGPPPPSRLILMVFILIEMNYDDKNNVSFIFLVSVMK